MDSRGGFNIAFIHFDLEHIVPHFAGPLKECLEIPGCRAEVLTYEGDHVFLYETLRKLHIDTGIVKQLPTFRWRKWKEKFEGRKMPSPHYLFKKHYREMLDNYDALIFNDINHTFLARNRKNRKPAFIMLMHGSGDGEYMLDNSYEKSLSEFDLITVAGQKIADIYSKMDLPETRITVCGYQKFDLFGKKMPAPLFDNANPTVIYNPHFKRELSSWYRFGIEILDFFYRRQDKYNLIFAPHINLFNKKGFLSPSDIPPKYYRASNIHIDTGSFRLVNMDYTLRADIYLGDVSSQIYEFLLRPRPAVFLNAHRVSWQENPYYRHWQSGKVIDRTDELENILDTSAQRQPSFVPVQKKLFSRTFADPAPLTASRKIAREIHKLLLEKQRHPD